MVHSSWIGVEATLRGSWRPGHEYSYSNRRPVIRWLEKSASRLALQGTVIAMATAVEIKNLVEVSLFGGGKRVTCFATVGCGNALSVGDPASVAIEQTAPSPLHTINLILTIQPGLRDEALVEAIQIATEGRVRALSEVPNGNATAASILSLAN